MITELIYIVVIISLIIDRKTYNDPIIKKLIAITGVLLLLSIWEYVSDTYLTMSSIISEIEFYVLVTLRLIAVIVLAYVVGKDLIKKTNKSRLDS